MRELLYGRNAVRECLRAGRRKVYKVLLAEGVRESGIIVEILDVARAHGAALQRVERQRLDGLGDVNHQGVAAEVEEYPYTDLEVMLRVAEERGELPLLLLLDCLQDPQNFGALLRTAETVGVHGVIIPKRRAVAVTPAVVNASVGAVEHLLVARMSNLVQVIGQLKAADIWVVGLEDVPEAQLYHRADLNMPLALVVGSEGEGMHRLVRERCDFLIRLPMRGHISSLNVSVAGSIALYEIWRQRESKGKNDHRSR
ncbi:MAG: 23S rRNA (guanosine(2251)-2'-O)-methyltransferase RlmB [Anaerolineae bacterium]|jgi:23S rRNA (guanosine2251-2'-O)-methyltransferase|nr:23S rRNA (guanosine(2251)-2'-O)-methyltransferase RlmB [Anaerolineae bacterium]MDH7473374.1 23S rRNA (guanosine(2251)-2'-O)-methyltransferase RlmB [Anaerolineae bacterium]